jgi:hypothetical protein
MQIVECEKYHLDASLKKILGEPTGGVVAKQVFPAIGTRPQHETVVVTTGPRKKQLVQCSPHIAIPGMPEIALAEPLIVLELISVALLSSIHFQSYMLTVPEIC